MIRYRMLGPLEAIDGDRAVDLGAPKQRAVLAVLLLERGRVVSTDRIIAAAWGDDPPPAVSSSLQAYISNLRRLLRDDDSGPAIERRSPGYRLIAPEEATDRSAFTALAARARQAVDESDWDGAVRAAAASIDCWRGPVLAELRDEPWVRVEADAIDELRNEAAEHLVTGLLGQDRIGDAIAESLRLLGTDSFRESAVRLHMIALHRAGRSVEALDAYRAHARRLDDELGLEPSPALRDLQAGVLRQAPELASWPRSARERAVAVPAPADPVERITYPDGLVGRRRELAVVRGLLSAQRSGRRWLVLTGPAGIGKTRLAEEVLAMAVTRGDRVVRAACPDDDGTPPWWPIRQLLRAEGLDADALLTPPSDAGADGARFAVYDRLDEALGAIRPTTLLIDDAHWADASTMRWLTHVAETAPASLLDLVLTVRDGVDASHLERLLAAIARLADSRQLAVPPLDPSEVAELAGRVSVDEVLPDELAALIARTGGNPFFISEYARLPRQERTAGGVPVAVRSVLRRRLATVDAAVLQVLRTAAVAGDRLDVELLRVVTRLDHDELADLLDDAVEQEIIVPLTDGGGYAFAHGLLRDEVLAGLSAPRRQRVHARMADALRGTPRREDVARRASHLVAALPLVPVDEVFEACRAAALDAESRWESEAAADWWAAADRAYGTLPVEEQDDEVRDGLLVAHVAALGRAGRRHTVIELVTDGLLQAVRADRIASAGRLAALTLRTSGIWPWTTFALDPGPLLMRLAGIEPLVRVDPGAHARVLAALAVGHYYDPDAAVPDRLSARAIEVAERLGDPEVLADALLGRALVLSGLASRAEESVRLIDRLLALPHRASGVDAVIRHDHLTLALMTLGDVAGAESALHAGIVGSDRLRLPVVRVQLRWAEANLALWQGDLDRSAALAGRAGELHAQTELYSSSVGGLTNPVMTKLVHAIAAGRFEDLAAPPEVGAQLPWLHAAVLLARGELEEGRAALEAAEAAPPRRELWSSLGELTVAALVVAARGERRFADPLLRRLAPFRSMIGAFGQIGHVEVVALAMARLAALDGRRDEALALLDEAEEIARRGRGAPALIRCRLLRAELVSATAEQLDAIAADATRTGLLRDAARARALRSALTAG